MLVVATGMMVARWPTSNSCTSRAFTPRSQSRTHRASSFPPPERWPKEAPSPWPTYSSNDRARWATVKALVEEGTFAIGERVPEPDPVKRTPYTDQGIAFTDGFGSVDKVLHPERQQFYSTKPPLLTMIVAGEYWVIREFFNKDMVEDRWEVVVPILLLTNVLPLVMALWLLSRLLERYGTSDWGRLFVFAAACFGTFLPTFATTLNNHVPAACCVIYAIYALVSWAGAGNASGRTPTSANGTRAWAASRVPRRTTPARRCGLRSSACSPGWRSASTCRPGLRRRWSGSSF